MLTYMSFKIFLRQIHKNGKEVVTHITHIMYGSKEGH